MKTVICLSLLFAAGLRADEPADRAAIEKTIALLNTAQPSAAFSPDADVAKELDRLSAVDRGMLLAQGRPWPETTTPRIVTQEIRFITPDVALVDAANTQYGSVILVRRVPLLLLMKREAQGWRIASLRVLVDCGALAR